jgi:hypothetical protein
MRTRKTALPALDSSQSEIDTQPRGRGSRRAASAGASTRPAAQAAQLALGMPEAVLSPGVVRSERPSGAASPRLDGARTAKFSIVRPTAASSTVRRNFGELREALQEGWEIVQPIFARPLWSVTDDSATAFSFVLRGPSGTRLITVPEGRTVERFIRDRQLCVDYAR